MAVSTIDFVPLLIANRTANALPNDAWSQNSAQITLVTSTRMGSTTEAGAVSAPPTSGQIWPRGK